MMPRDRMPAIGFLATSAACVIVGCANILAARNDALQQVVVNPKAGPVSGWNTPPVLAVTAITLILLVVTAWSIDRGGTWWGVLCTVLALISLTVIWFDCYAVSRTPGVIEGGGPANVWNTAGQYLDHASLLFLAAGAICVIALFIFHGRLTAESRYPTSVPGRPLPR